MPSRRISVYGEKRSSRREDWANQVLELVKSTYIRKAFIFGEREAAGTRSQLRTYMLGLDVGRDPLPATDNFHALMTRVEEALDQALGTLFDSYPNPIPGYGGRNISQEAYRIRSSYDEPTLGIPTGVPVVFEGTEPALLFRDLTTFLKQIDDGYGCTIGVGGPYSPRTFVYSWPDQSPIKYSYTEGSMVHLLTFYGAPTSGPEGEPIFDNEEDFERWRTATTSERYVRDLDCPSPPAAGAVGDFGGVPDIDMDGIPDSEDTTPTGGDTPLDPFDPTMGDFDEDGDGVPDAADDDYTPPRTTDLENVVDETPPLCSDANAEIEGMPICTKDPGAPVEDWSTTDQVFLNPNNCEYYVPVDTDFECPGADELENRIFSRIGRSTDALFDYLNIGNLDDDPDAPLKAQILGEYIRTRGSIAYEYEKFPRRNLRALYKYPFYLVSALGLVESSGEDTSTPSSYESVIIPADHLLRNISRLRRALRKLAYRQIRAIGDDRFTLVIGGSDLQVNLIEEVKLIQKLRSELGDLLKNNNFILPNPANRIRSSRSQIDLPNEKAVANEILISIDQNYRMSTMFAKPIGTGFRKLNTSSVSPSSIFNNPTMVFYLANLPQIIDVIETPSGLTINDLTTSFHYPAIF